MLQIHLKVKVQILILAQLTSTDPISYYYHSNAFVP
jgi:hypothetical protein